MADPNVAVIQSHNGVTVVLKNDEHELHQFVSYSDLEGAFSPRAHVWDVLSKMFRTWESETNTILSVHWKDETYDNLLPDDDEFRNG